MAEMFYVQCPHCHSRTKAEARHLGKKVRCPHCKQQFVVQMASPPSEPSLLPEPPLPPEPPPAPPPEETPPPVPPPVSEETSPVGFESAEASWSERYRRAAQRGGLEPATRLVDLLDLRLKKYLTPWFLRIYWGLTLLWLLYTIPTTIWNTIAESDDPFDRPRISLLDPSPVPNLRQESEGDRLLNEVLVKLFRAVVKTILILVGVMFVRIVLEFFIVLFNIAQAAQAVEKRLEQIENKLPAAAP